MANKKSKAESNLLATNRKAFHNYEILDRYEAGIVLAGTEVKSCRERSISCADAFVSLERGEAWLLNVHIAGYDYGNRFNHDVRRKRKLLLHRMEILRLSQKVKEKGLTVVPLRFYLSRGIIKVELGLARGKNTVDKRDSLRDRQDDREIRRALKNNRAF